MKYVLILSGGLDSTTLLYKLLNKNNEVHLLSFNYGQRASKELEFAKKTCEKLNVPFQIINLKNLQFLFKASSVVNLNKNMVKNPKETVIPNRNTILLELATAYAISNNIDSIYFGIHKSNQDDYPDTTPKFLKSINELNKVNNYKYISILTPYYEYEKKDFLVSK